jgi:hypothetical protein
MGRYVAPLGYIFLIPSQPVLYGACLVEKQQILFVSLVWPDWSLNSRPNHKNVNVKNWFPVHMVTIHPFNIQ